MQLPLFGGLSSQETQRFVFPFVTPTLHGEADVFVQLAGFGPATRAMCTKLRYTAAGRVVLTLEDTAEQVVLIDRGRYELPLIEARVGRHTEVTLAGPGGGRIMLQLQQRKRPRHPEGDGAVAAC
jgi:hypothetical protein